MYDDNTGSAIIDNITKTILTTQDRHAADAATGYPPLDQPLAA